MGKKGWIVTAVLFALLPCAVADEYHCDEKHHYRRYIGNYYPGPYYSRAYLQDYPLDPGDRPLLFRLHPFQHYGRYKYGQPIEPCLTNGTVESDRFPYRYTWDFHPTEPPPREYYDPCTDPYRRQYDKIDNVTPQAPPPNEPFELPQSKKGKQQEASPAHDRTASHRSATSVTRSRH